ncbi:MAG: DUF6134 family protein [Azospirillaceae bacterium]|nr:DUF6134 family protein [Azospirillaceae bacterium]
MRLPAMILATALIWGGTAPAATPPDLAHPNAGATPAHADLTAGPSPMPTTPDTAVEQSLDFFAHYGHDTPLGHHKVTVARAANGDTVVDVDISFEAKVLMLTAYRYHHVDHEIWRGGRLLALETSTNDNGDTDWVRGHATPDGFAVESSRGKVTAPADIVPTSYWNPATLTAPRLLDTVRGVVMDTRVDRKEPEVIKAGDVKLSATRYTLTFTTNPPPATSHLDFWYDESGHWLKMAFRARGHDVAYALEGTPPGGTLVAGPGSDTVLPAPEGDRKD